MNLEQARFNMIEQQIRPWGVLDQTILDTLSLVPREKFVPQAWLNLAFADTQIPLAHGECMMHPRVEARMLQALAIQPNDLCLEIGTGSGYVTACLAQLGREVDSIDIHENFITQAAERLQQLDLRNSNFSVGNALDALKNNTPEYDVIAVTASAPDYLPQLEQQLVIGGRLFVIIGERNPMQAIVVTREDQDTFERTVLFETALKPLNGYAAEPAFEF